MVGRRILAAVCLSAALGVTMARAQEPIEILAKNGLTKSGSVFRDRVGRAGHAKAVQLAAGDGSDGTEIHGIGGDLSKRIRIPDAQRLPHPGSRPSERRQKPGQRDAIAQSLQEDRRRPTRRSIRGPSNRSCATPIPSSSGGEACWSVRRRKPRPSAISRIAATSFVKAKAEMWPVGGRDPEEYEQLKENESVMNALRAYNQEVKAHLKLGPSDKLKKSAQAGRRLRAELFTGDGVQAQEDVEAEGPADEEEEEVIALVPRAFAGDSQ